MQVMATELLVAKAVQQLLHGVACCMFNHAQVPLQWIICSANASVQETGRLHTWGSIEQFMLWVYWSWLVRMAVNFTGQPTDTTVAESPANLSYPKTNYSTVCCQWVPVCSLMPLGFLHALAVNNTAAVVWPRHNTFPPPHELTTAHSCCAAVLLLPCSTWQLLSNFSSKEMNMRLLSCRRVLSPSLILA